LTTAVSLPLTVTSVPENWRLTLPLALTVIVPTDPPPKAFANGGIANEQDPLAWHAMSKDWPLLVNCHTCVPDVAA
jgi:hypothetical protein